MNSEVNYQVRSEIRGQIRDRIWDESNYLYLLPRFKKKRRITMWKTLLNYIEKNGPISPQELESKNPDGLSSESVRFLISHLMDKGYIRLDDDLKLVLSKRT